MGQVMDTNTGTSNIKVIIVDDQEVIREAFGMLLDSDESVDLVGVLGDGDSAVQMIPVHLLCQGFARTGIAAHYPTSTSS